MTQPFNPQAIQLVNRAAVINVGGVLVQDIGQNIGLDAWFQVRRSLKANEPNTCDLRLYNLSADTLALLAASSVPFPSPADAPGAPLTVVPVSIVAGYVGGTSSIFLGEMRSAQTVIDGPDYVTELTTGDGDTAMILARTSVSFPPGTSATAVVTKLLADMLVGPGNLGTVSAFLEASSLYRGGATFKGSSWDILRDLCRSVGLEVSIQGGVAQFTLNGLPIGAQTYLLSTDPVNTGVLGSPTVDTKGVLNIKTLMLPGIAPGVTVVVASEFVQGAYRVISVETTGDTAGADWGHSIEAKKIGLAP